MNVFKITLETGSTFITSMNATIEEARAYYINHSFQFGDAVEYPRDLMVKAVKVDEVA